MLIIHRLLLEIRGGFYVLVLTAGCQWRQNLRRLCRTSVIVYVLSIIASAAVGKAAAASLNVKALSRHDITDVVNFISSRRGGCVTVAIDNHYQTRCGPQDLKYINANTINIDLQIIGVKPKDLDRLLTVQARLHLVKKSAGAKIVSSAELAGSKIAKAGGNSANLGTSSQPGAVTVSTVPPVSEQPPALVKETPSGENHKKGLGNFPWLWAVGLLVLTPVGLFYLLNHFKVRHKTKFGLSGGDHGMPEGGSASAGKITGGEADGEQKEYDHAWLKKYGFDYGDDERDALVEDGPGERGYNPQGFDENGYDLEGYNREGRDGWGYDRAGYNSSGYDRYGYDKEGFDCKGYDKAGFDREGYDTSGYNRSGQKRRGSYRSGYGRYGLTRRK